MQKRVLGGGLGAGLGKLDCRINLGVGLLGNLSDLFFGEVTSFNKCCCVTRNWVTFVNGVQVLASVCLGVTFEVAPQSQGVKFQQTRTLAGPSPIYCGTRRFEYCLYVVIFNAYAGNSLSGCTVSV